MQIQACYKLQESELIYRFLVVVGVDNVLTTQIFRCAARTCLECQWSLCNALLTIMATWFRLFSCSCRSSSTTNKDSRCDSFQNFGSSYHPFLLPLHIERMFKIVPNAI